MKLLPLVVLTLCAGAAPAGAQTNADLTAASLRDSSCSTCHGAEGNSRIGTVPRLNGQSATYLRARLESFRYPIKESPRAIHFMGIMGADLTSEVIDSLAGFYASQLPPGVPVKPNKLGAAIYRKGAKDIPACRECHGQAGEGSNSAPRLAGQHRAYLALQLQAFANAARISDPMTHHVW